MNTGVDKPLTVSSVALSNLSGGYPLSEFSRLHRTGVCPLSGYCPDSVFGVCPSGFCLSRFCPVSGFSKKNCPLSVRPDKIETDLVDGKSTSNKGNSPKIWCIGISVKKYPQVLEFIQIGSIVLVENACRSSAF